MPVFSSLQNRNKLDVKFIKANSSNSVIRSTNRFSETRELLDYAGKINNSNIVKKPPVYALKSNTKNRVSKTPTKNSPSRSQSRNHSPSILSNNFRLSESQWYTAQRGNISSSNSSTFFEASSANDSPEIILDTDDYFECDSTSQKSDTLNEKPKRGRKSLVSVTKSKNKTVKESTQRKSQLRKSYNKIADSSKSSQELFSSEEHDLSDDVQFVCQSKAVLPSPENEPSQYTPRKNSSQRASKTKDKKCNTPNSTKSLRYPLRNVTTISPVIYDLPDSRVRRRSSILTVDNSPETMKQMKPRVSSKKSVTSRQNAENQNSLFSSSFQPSQDSYVYDSLENLGQKENSYDLYEFIPSPPMIPNRSRKTPTKRKTGSSQTQMTTKTSKSAANTTNQLFEISSTTSTSSKTTVNRASKVPDKPLKPLNGKISKSQIIEKVSKPKTKKVEQLQSQKIVLPSRKPLTNILKDIKNTPKSAPRNPKILKDTSSSSDLTSTSYDDLSQHLNSIFIDRNTPQMFQMSQNSIDNSFFSFDSANSTQSSFNFGKEKSNSQSNFNCSFGNLLASADDKNHINYQPDIQQLCHLFSCLKIEDGFKLRRSSFLAYRDPNVKQKLFTPAKLITRTPVKMQPRESRFSNFHRNFNISPKKSQIFSPRGITGKLDLNFSPKVAALKPDFNFTPKKSEIFSSRLSTPKPASKEVLNQPKTAELPIFQMDKKDENLDVSSVSGRITQFERTLPNYFLFDGGESEMEGYEEWK